MRMKGVRGWALAGMVIGATLFGWSDADAVLCVKKNKKGVIAKVTVRDGACKGKESVGDPSVLLGLPTTTTTTTTTTLPSEAPKKAARIVDSAGNPVAWVNPNLGALNQAIWALRTIDDQTITFPMSSNGPSAVTSGPVVDDFQYGFAHEGTQCVGDRFSLLPDLLALTSGFGGLVKIAYPSTDGKSGYMIPFEPIQSSTTVYSKDDLQVECATPPDPVPPTVTCPEPGLPVGSAFACLPNPLLVTDPTTQCACIRCCVTGSVPPGTALYPVRTIDLGLGNSTPPFKIER